MNENLKKYKDMDLEIFLIVNRLYWDKYSELMERLPFQTKMIDPGTREGSDFVREIIDLNEKAYGKGMAAPDWTFANFGTIGAGLTAGFLVNNKPISKLSLVGNIADTKVAHEWTLLVDPKYEGKGIGTITFALALHLAQDKEFLTFIIQTDNASSNIYLKTTNPLNIMSYGFVHTCQNSLFIKTKVPKENAFESLLNNKIISYNFEDYVEAKEKISEDGKPFWIRHDNENLYRNLNERLENGEKYTLKGKTQKENYTYFLIEKG